MKKVLRPLASVAMALAALVPQARAGTVDYPDRMVRIVVPYPAGGATDVALRMVAERLGAAWHQPIVVENRPGASGRTGLMTVAKSPASYTFVAATNSTICDELLHPGDDSVQLMRDLAPVGMVFSTPVVLVVNKSMNVSTLAQYEREARRHPGTVSFGSSGLGTSTHFYGELLRRASGIEITHVPYAGEGPNANDLLGGHISSAFLSAFGAKKLDRTGTVRMLAVTTPARSPLLPGVASFTELGVKGLDRDSWVGLFAPAATPMEVREKVADAIRRIAAQPDVRERLAALGLVAEGSTPQELDRRMQADRAYWAKAIQVTGIRLE